MAKWEYAAIVEDGAMTIGENPDEKDNLHFARFLLVQPGGDLHLFQSFDDLGKSPRKRKMDKLASFQTQTWSIPISVTKYREERLTSLKGGQPSFFKQNGEITNPSPRILYESTDVLHLVNLAGADGWEITGALGLPGVPEHRMMRREI
jgi:hypothetical protein